MTRRRSVSVVAAVLALTALVVPVSSTAASLKSERAAGLSFPLAAVSDTQGTFNGTLRIFRFGVQDGALVASGLVTGTLVDENGVVTAVARTVTVPMIATTASAARGDAAAAVIACDVLHLELGPLDLDLLGLVVHLDKVVLDITAVPGAGNLLGNLLCAITNLLNGGGPLTAIANLLNQLLDILS
jgi:hypothetical protein